MFQLNAANCNYVWPLFNTDIYSGQYETFDSGFVSCFGVLVHEVWVHEIKAYKINNFNYHLFSIY